jgi:23S rRNA pseudouridine2605 synthase
MVYYAINKPKGYVSTNNDPAGRPRVVDLLPEIPERVYTVGRLDEESTGLMILTNDGELANRLAHPRYGVEKLYRALIAGAPDREVLAKLTSGIWLSDGKVRAKRARLVGRQGQANVLELVLAEGKNREIRRMLARLGHKVMSLTRVAVGPISVKGLSIGECRSLSRHEVELLWKVANGAAVSVPRHLDRDSSSRPPRDPNRPRKGERGRAGHDQAGPPRKHYRDSGPVLGPPGGPKQGRPPMPPRPIQNQAPMPPRSEQNRPPMLPRPDKNRPPMPPRPDQTRPAQARPADAVSLHLNMPPSARGQKTAGKRVPHIPIGKGPPVRAKPLPAPPPARRRIIGLENEPPTLPGPHANRERGRKRPAPRKQRPAPQSPGKRPIVPFRLPGSDGEDA